MDANQPFDPREFLPFAIGFGLGLLILAFFVVLGVGIDLASAFRFGIPLQ